ncbi:hypothetical protein AKO1_002168, partial [Acrasis kona]
MDVADFTTISEMLASEDLLYVMSTLFGECSRIILSQEGQIDKYIGDCIMAFWGAPNRVEHMELKMAKAAIMIQQFVSGFRERMLEEGKPSIHVRIGMHCSDVLVGNFGSPQRLSYTCMGNGVNLASRLEGANKYFGSCMIMSDVVYEAMLRSINLQRYDNELQITDDIDYMVQNEYIRVRTLATTVVKGKTVPCTVYELVYDDGEFPEEYKMYENAYNLFQKGDFTNALNEFTALKNMKGHVDYVVEKKIKLCNEYIEHTPSDWNG